MRALETSAAAYVFTLGVIEGGASTHRLAKLEEGRLFCLTRDAGDNVPGEAADDDGLVGREVHRADDVANDGGERVSVIKAEWRHPMALAAKIYRCRQCHLLAMARIPERPRRVMPIGCRFVQRTFGQAQQGILGSDKIP